MNRVWGVDLSLNHGAVVELVAQDAEPRLTNLWYATNIKSSAEKGGKRGFRVPAFKSDDRTVQEVARLDWWDGFFEDLLNNALNDGNLPDAIGIEDYALGESQGAHQLGEIGGLFRLKMWKWLMNMRPIDTTVVKMWATFKGNTPKEEVEPWVAKRWNLDFSKYNPPLAKPTAKNPDPKQNRTTSGDLADAYVIARIVMAECQLRSGVLTLKELNEKEVQVFNRITKAHPVPVLSRGWVFKGELRDGG